MYVVTGAAGFIGSNVVADLEEAGLGPIVAVDWFGDGEKWRNLAKRRIEAFVAPDKLLDFLDRYHEQIRAVIHMGAISATTERDLDRLIALNIQYSVSLWDWCATQNVPFVYASSAATYGGLESGFIDDDQVDALAALRPLNGYGWSKKATDDIFAARVARGDRKPPQWVGLKFFNVYGPNEYHKNDMMSVVAKIFHTVQRGETVTLFKSYRDDIADGAQRRDFVYVRDCTKAILWFLRNAQASGIFNLGSGKARSFLDIVRAMEIALGQSISHAFIEMPEAIRNRYQYFTEADVSKLRRAGYRDAMFDLEAGVADYVRYLSREDPYR